MPFCPECHYEYKAGIKTCPDCNVNLVKHLETSPEESEDIKWVPLHTQPGRVYSEMVIETLKKEGIPCVLDPGNVSALAAKGVSLTGDESRIYVPEKYFKKANDILNQMLDHI